MANYGFKTYTAQQKNDNWKQNVAKEVSIAKSHMNKFTELDPASGLTAMQEKAEHSKRAYLSTKLLQHHKRASRQTTLRHCTQILRGVQPKAPQR